jgi:SAM-dependent methyltransferase
VSRPVQRGSASIEHPEYWWFRARAGLLHAALAEYLGDPERLLDVGSADGPSVGWMESRSRFTVDLDPRGLQGGRGVCASALALPFDDDTFDVVGAFDVIEHCEPESQAMQELVRVLVPGGRLLISVPAYQWAWSDHDVLAGHYRRYTKPRLLRAARASGLDVVRATYAFGSVFPFFAAERAVRRLRPRAADAEQRLPSVSPALDRLLMGLTSAEQRFLRSRDVPWGSSVLMAAVKPHRAGRAHTQVSASEPRRG